MILTYKTTKEGIIEEKKTIEKNSWINLISPSEEELKEVSKLYKIPFEFLENPLDLEESARIEYDEDANCTLIINDFPIIDTNNNQFDSYITIPIGIIIGTDCIVTVCNQPCTILGNFVNKK